MLYTNITTAYVLNELVQRTLLYLIAVPCFIILPIGVLNWFLLAYSSRYWKQVRNKATHVNDANYKTATVNYVKFGLSSLIILSEVFLILSQILIHALLEFQSHVIEYYHIEGHHAKLMSYRYYEGITLILLIIPISLFNMLCAYLVQVVSNSNIDFHILHRECKRTFWLCILTMALTTVGNTLVALVGVIVTDIIHICYCWIVYKQLKKLYAALKSKCLDYLYEPKKRKIFSSQVKTFKWSALFVGIFAGAFIISNAVLTAYESIFKIVVYFLIPDSHISSSEYTHFHSVYKIGYSILAIIERISFANWGFISTLLNCILLFSFIRKALRYRQLMSKPFHIKLIHSDNGNRLVYKRVNY